MIPFRIFSLRNIHSSDPFQNYLKPGKVILSVHFRINLAFKCDLLEFNECEEDEYRCDNGMCIPEDFWLDGVLDPFNITDGYKYPIESDCMDWTDERYGLHTGYWCPTNPRNIECDEHMTPIRYWSCGDGQFISWSDRMVLQHVLPPYETSYNGRNLYYFCELLKLLERYRINGRPDGRTHRPILVVYSLFGYTKNYRYIAYS
ncbi:unnamed protein product [Adineta ricciae]|uniref:Uncharacterized protein n=1 Tax=Adineta ricciae TaxID=249248 RepID=A0A815X0N1_ADIRI|nr:unnamed protein product [Adineta ricciae]